MKYMFAAWRDLGGKKSLKTLISRSIATDEF